MKQLREGLRAPGRLTESTNLDPCELPETEPSTKEHGLDLVSSRHHTHMKQMCGLAFMWVPQQLELGLSLNLLPAYGSHFPNRATLVSVGEDVASTIVTWYAKVGWYPESFPVLRGKGDRGKRDELHEGGLGGGCWYWDANRINK